MNSATSVASIFLRVVIASTAGYISFLCLLTVPALQNQVIYLNKVRLTWFKDVNVPEQWGFLHNQVTPFILRTTDGESLHAWHILSLEVYRRNEHQLLAEPAGLAADIRQRLSFRLLRNDPQALLVIYLHGAAGTLGSGYRPPSYRALYAGAPDKIHVVAIDYRGFGQSSGAPSEEGLLTDAQTLVDWAMHTAGIPASRIVLFGQSLGTAVGMSLATHLAQQSPPVLFAGMVFVAPFVDVEALTATYKVGGVVPILSPVAYFPRLLSLLNACIKSKWPSKSKLTEFIRLHETMTTTTRETYHVTFIHAKDDYDIPWTHTEQLFWHAVNASLPSGISYEALEERKASQRQSLGAGGWVVECRTERGVIREHIIEHGMHDITMSYPVVSLAVLKAFNNALSLGNKS